MMKKGKVKWFNPEKEFGFIAPDDRSADIFIHLDIVRKSGLKTLNENDKVVVETAPGEKGPKATKVCVFPIAAEQDDMAQDTPVNIQSPYNFHKRSTNTKDIFKKYLSHEKLESDRFDVAFEIEWKTLTPTAANPCTDPEMTESPEGAKKDEYKGYNKRWLMIDNRLAISPFTVKSAIANGFANIMGACYRLVKDIEGHPDKIEEGKYYQTGKYKRYRVARDKSYAGVIEKIQKNGDNWDVVIQQVTEIYMDDDSALPEFVKAGKKVYAKLDRKDINKIIIEPGSLRDASGNKKKKEEEEEIFYVGKYAFGMDLTLPSEGRLGKKHHYRFYSTYNFRKKKQHECCYGTISSTHFEPLQELKKKVYMGKFTRLAQNPIPIGIFNDICTKLNAADKRRLIELYSRTDNAGNPKLRGDILKLSGEIFGLFDKAQYEYDTRSACEGQPWFEHLVADQLKGAFVFFQTFNGKVTNIGKNFLFKALFCIDDAVPEGVSACNILDELCLRCSMFGMVGKTGADENTGYRGRFKSATLINSKKLTIDTRQERPVQGLGNKTHVCWKDNNIFICGQYLLPVQGPPKANKRDVNGYYDKKTGQIEGAKYYYHAPIQIDALVSNTDKHPPVNGMPYAHKLRNFAVVCQPEEIFTGTVGAENCSIKEIAAFILLLQSSEVGYGFKVGLGKSFGLGSISSSIRTVWIREVSSTDGADKKYSWLKPVNLQDFLNLWMDIAKEKDNLKAVLQKVDLLELADKNQPSVPKGIRLEFPDPGQGYWKTFKEKSPKKM